VIADNDESGTGERVAKESGLKYWMSDKVGEDFNDFHQRNHLF
jgi:putative DNA primase/helicase